LSVGSGGALYHLKKLIATGAIVRTGVRSNAQYQLP